MIELQILNVILFNRESRIDVKACNKENIDRNATTVYNDNMNQFL